MFIIIFSISIFTGMIPLHLITLPINIAKYRMSLQSEIQHFAREDRLSSLQTLHIPTTGVTEKPLVQLR